MTEQYKQQDIRSGIIFRNAIKPGGSAEIAHPKSFSLKDYKWNENYQINGTDDLHLDDTTPKLVLIERQPIKKPDWAKVVSDLQAVADIPVVNNLVKAALVPANSVSQVAGAMTLNSLTDKYSADDSAGRDLLDIADLEYLIEGPIVASYEIPFFNDSYMKSNNRDGWSIGSAIDSLGPFTDVINDGFQLNMLKTPQWQNTNSEGMDWEVEFFLINNDLDSLQQNFQFINALYPSSQWVRMKSDLISNLITDADTQLAKVPLYNNANFGNQRGLQALNNSISFTKSPNVFRVECPGRFLQLFVAIDMEISYVGNVRQMPLYERINNVPLINRNTLYPDAYRVRLMARDLTPNCYNVYASYLMNNELVTVHSGAASAKSRSRVTPI